MGSKSGFKQLLFSTQLRLMKIHPFEKMFPVDGEHVGVDLGAVHGLVAQELADVFQGPPVQQQMDGEGVPKRVRADGKIRAPYPLY